LPVLDQRPSVSAKERQSKSLRSTSDSLKPLSVEDAASVADEVAVDAAMDHSAEEARVATVDEVATEAARVDTVAVEATEEAEAVAMVLQEVAEVPKVVLEEAPVVPLILRTPMLSQAWDHRLLVWFRLRQKDMSRHLPFCLVH